MQYFIENYDSFDDYDNDSIYKSIIEDLETLYGKDIKWYKAQDVLDYIKEAVDNGEDSGEIYDKAASMLEGI